MSVSPDAEDFIVAEWEAALADAGAPELDFHLIVCSGAAVTGYPKAVAFRPGDILEGDEAEGGVVVEAGKLAEANHPAVLRRHRVAVLEDIDPDDQLDLAFLAGVIRHEIEHAKQRDVADEAFDLQGLVGAIVNVACGGDKEQYRELINSSPLEADANAAAAAFLRRRYPAAIPGLLDGGDRYLAYVAETPGHPDTLIQRTVDFLWQFANICNDPLRLPLGSTFAAVLDGRASGSGDLWRERERSKPA